MKKMILTASLISMLFFAGSALAVDEHHPEKKDAPAAAQMKTDQMEMGQMDAQTKKMEEMRKRIETEKDPAARKALMQEQMQMMKDCMKMMDGKDMMGGKAMMGDKGMPMDDRMGTMEKKMKMMQEMMNGMMMHQETETK
jgi:hypothetical protein